ncbi:MAG: sugar phosphate isomerase/epimerase [Phycisphaerales bacterium]|nr:MAG: sugar phosphate isomerase/epimerase [Phycisphaerales bacterium]
MYLSYNTNGLAYHRLDDALTLIAEHGYRGVALTLDHHHLDPTDRERAVAEAKRLRPITARLGLTATIETGARFILDPRRKHQPTLISRSPAGRARRIEFLVTACHVARAFGGGCVSLWSGAADAATSPEPAGAPEAAEPEKALFARLTASVRQVLDAARPLGVTLGFEPEPGMFIDTLARYDRLAAAVDDPLFGLTLDVTHVHCLGDGDPAAHIRRRGASLGNVHVADMRRGVHDHLPFGEGDMCFEPIFAALHDVAYAGPISVELPRHGHVAVESLARSFAFLTPFMRP